MKYFLICLINLLVLTASAQDEFTLPKYKEGTDKVLKEYFEKNLKFPEEDYDKDIAVSILTRCRIDRKGKIEIVDIGNCQPLTQNIKNSITQLIHKLPQFIPGKMNGKVAPFNCSFLIYFINSPNQNIARCSIAYVMNIYYPCSEAMKTIAINSDSVMNKVKEISFSCVEQPPMFPPKWKESLNNYFKQHIDTKFLKEATKFHVAYFELLIKQDGTVGNIDILQGISTTFDREVIKIIKNMPKWLPAKNNNATEDYYIRIKFTINETNTDIESEMLW